MFHGKDELMKNPLQRKNKQIWKKFRDLCPFMVKTIYEWSQQKSTKLLRELKKISFCDKRERNFSLKIVLFRFQHPNRHRMRRCNPKGCCVCVCENEMKFSQISKVSRSGRWWWERENATNFLLFVFFGVSRIFCRNSLFLLPHTTKRIIYWSIFVCFNIFFIMCRGNSKIQKKCIKTSTKEEAESKILHNLQS
jgi:hypothetical protein